MGNEPGSGRAATRTRSASVLLIVVGLSALLLSLVTVALVKVRADASGSLVVLRDAQARIMLSAALHYLQETARMGWGGNDPAAHSYGWTDIRDGKPGPRGPAAADGTIANQGWSTGGTWPAPGSAMRGDCFRWELPPYAIRPVAEPNALQLPDALRDEAVIKKYTATYPVAQDPINGRDRRFNFDDLSQAWTDTIVNSRNKGFAMLDPQPVADTWSAFSAGRKREVPSSVGRAWFRIYRETPADHNGDGDPWYDTMPLAGHGVFIITIGGGSTRGWRFWDTTNDYLGGIARTAAYSQQIEPQTAAGSGLFSEAAFQTARAGERILWFRVQWEPNLGGFDAHNIFGGWDQKFAQNGQSNDNDQIPNFGGAFTLIQRLEREPPRW